MAKNQDRVKRNNAKKTDKPNIYVDEFAVQNPYWIQFMMNGKRYTKRGFKNIREAQAHLSDMQSQIRNGTYIEPSNTLFKEYFKEWLTTKTDISPETKELYDSFLRIHIDPFFKNITLDKLNAAHIQKFLSKLYEKGLSDNSVKRIFSALNASLNSAERMDLVHKNVANKVNKPKVKKRKLNVWDIDTVSKVVNELLDTSRYGIVIYLAVMTGMRRGEILGLRWQDIDFDKKFISIQQTMTPKKRIKDGAKTEGSSRSIAISDETIKVLKKHKARINEEKLEIGEKYPKFDLVVCTNTGKPCNPEHVQRLWKRMLNKHNLPNITLRDLRHTHASLLLKQGVHPKVVSERLGHSSVNITLDIYSHILPNIQEEAVKGLDQMIYGQKGKEDV